MSTPPLFPLFFVVWVYLDSEVKEKWMGWLTRLCTWTASDIFHWFQSSLEALIIVLFLVFFPHSLRYRYIALSDRAIIGIKGVCLFMSSKWCQTKMQPSAQLSVILQPLRDCPWQHLFCSLSSIHFLISCSSLHHCVSLRSGCTSHFPTAFIPTHPISFSFFFSWIQSVISYVLEHVIYYPIHLGKVGPQSFLFSFLLGAKISSLSPPRRSSTFQKYCSLFSFSQQWKCLTYFADV